MTDGLFSDDVKTIEHADMVSILLSARGSGKTMVEAAALAGCSLRHAERLLAEMGEKMRKRNDARVSRRFLEHDARCEHLYSLVVAEINKQAAAGAFDEKLIRAAVTVLDRQARLLGLDAVKSTDKRHGPNEWAEEAPLKDVMAEAKRLGLVLPTGFETRARE